MRRICAGSADLRVVVVIVLGLAGTARADVAELERATTMMSAAKDCQLTPAMQVTRAALAKGPTPTAATLDRVLGALGHQATAVAACRQKLAAKLVVDFARELVIAGKQAITAAPTTRAPTGDQVTPVAIPERHRRWLEVIALYRSTADAADPERVALGFLAANVYRKFDQLDQALPLFLEIIDRHPGHPTAELAVNLALDSYNRLKQYDKLVALAERLVADAKFLAGKRDLEAILERLVRQGRRMRAEQACSKPATALAGAELYMKAYEDKPADGVELLYNAAICFEQARHAKQAIRALDTLRIKHPRDKLVVRAMPRLALLYELIGMLDRAAEIHEDFAARFPAEATAPEALADAAHYHRVSGRDAKAIAVTRRLATTHGKRHPEIVGDAQLALLPIFERRGDDAVIAHLRALVSRRAGRDLLGRVHHELGRALWRKSCPVRAIDGLCIKPGPRPRCSSRSSLVVVPRTRALVDEARRELRRSIDTNEPKLQDARAQAKVAFADHQLETTLLQRRPTDLIADGYRGAFEVTVLARLGIVEHILADVARGKAGACPDVQRVAGEHERRAIASYQSCLAAATKLGVLHTASCERGLAQLAPARAVTDPLPVPALRTFAIESEPADDKSAAATRSNQGAAAARAGKLADARAHWLAAVAADERMAAAHTNLAAALLAELHKRPANAKQLDETARLHVHKALATGRTPANGFVLLAALAMAADRLALAEAMISIAYQLDDKSRRVKVALGVLYARRGDSVRAIAALDAAAGDPDAELTRAVLAIRLRDHENARSRLAKLTPDPAWRYEYLMTTGAAQRGTGRIDEAKVTYRQAIALDPARPEASAALRALEAPTP